MTTTAFTPEERALADLLPPSWGITCDRADHEHRSLAEARYCTWLAETGRNAPVDPAFLEGRTARCGCGEERPSEERDRLFGFEYLGAGSRESMDSCAHDRFRFEAHVADATRTQRRLDCLFAPLGAQDRDRFYCGHNGWD